jgi:hypothetical protein
LNRFYIERSPLPSAFAGYAPLPSLALLSAFGPPPHNTQYLGIGLFLLRSALWEQLSGSYLAFSASPTLPVAAGLAPAVLAEIASSVPIPLNIDIMVRLLLLLVTSKNEINENVYR